MICGFVGCGRYVGGHSHAHFLETEHSYTMELGQNRVWDYVGDNFVHRLVQTDSADGKLVEAEGHGLNYCKGTCFFFFSFHLSSKNTNDIAHWSKEIVVGTPKIRHHFA